MRADSGTTANLPAAPRVVVLGDLNVDIFGRLNAPALIGGDCLAPELELHCGGVATNTALALARWGESVRLVGCVGSDWFGDFLLTTLRRAGVEADFVQQTPQALTGLILVAVNPDGQRTMFGSRGANQVLTESFDARQVLQGVAGLQLVGYNFLTPSAAKAAGRLLEEMRSQGGWICLDVGMAPSQQIPQVILETAKKVDTVFLSGDEATLLTGESEPQKAFAALAQQGVREPIMKLGREGCLFQQQGTLRRAPAFAVQVVDSTGAGDAFAAALLRGRLRGWPQDESALFANAAGALAASVLGAGENLPALKPVLEWLSTAPLPAEWQPIREGACERLRKELQQPTATS